MIDGLLFIAAAILLFCSGVVVGWLAALPTSPKKGIWRDPFDRS